VTPDKKRLLIAWWPIIFLVALAIVLWFYLVVLMPHMGGPAY
jgi:hypothetical protein